MLKPELRKEERYKAELLPEYLREVTVLMNSDFLQCKVTDASLNGFGFIAKRPEQHFIVGTNLALYPLDENHHIYGKITFAKAINEEFTRIGVELKPVGTEFEKYQVELKRIIYKISKEKVGQ
jgi:hypothetical protein